MESIWWSTTNSRFIRNESSEVVCPDGELGCDCSPPQRHPSRVSLGVVFFESEDHLGNLDIKKNGCGSERNDREPLQWTVGKGSFFNSRLRGKKTK